MKKIMFLLPLILFSSACFWDQGNGGGGGGGAPVSPSSNILVSSTDLGVVKIGEPKSGQFNIRHSFDEDADVLIKLADDGITDKGVFTITPDGQCKNEDGYFLLALGSECLYHYTFTPREYKYYTNVVSIDIMGKSFYETGDISRKRRIDLYFTGAGSPDGTTLPPDDYTINFNGVNRYYVDGYPQIDDGRPKLGEAVLGISFKNETTAGHKYNLTKSDGKTPYNSDAAEFKVVIDNSVASNCQINNSGFYLEAGASCVLYFSYVPHSKTERGEMYLVPEDGGAFQRIFFFGEAYPVKFLPQGETADWGSVGVNFTLPDTILDLKGRITRGEELTENFDNPQDFLIYLAKVDDNDTTYKLGFDQTKDFSINDKLTNCMISGDKINLSSIDSCTMAVTFKPKEARDYNEGALSLTSENNPSRVYNYLFKGRGALMRRPDAVEHTAMLPSDYKEDTFDCLTTNCNAPGLSSANKLYFSLTLTADTKYSFSSNTVAAQVEKNLYPSCVVDGDMFRLKEGLSDCMVYVSFSPPLATGDSATLSVGGKDYKFLVTN